MEELFTAHLSGRLLVRGMVHIKKDEVTEPMDNNCPTVFLGDCG